MDPSLGPPPPGTPMPGIPVFPNGTKFNETPDWAGGTQANLNIALVVISTLLLSLRLYVRFFMTKTPGWDDLVAVFAWGVVVSQSGWNIHLKDVGAGAHMNLLEQWQLMAFFVGLNNLNLLYFWGVGLCRIAILAFLPRLSKDRVYLILVWTLTAMVLVTTLGCFFFRLFQCTPVQDGWLPPVFPGRNCVPQTSLDAMMTAHGVLGIIFDVCLMALPIWVIYTKMMWSKKTIQVAAVFGVGIFVIVTGIIRLYYIQTMDWGVDSTFKMSTIGVWTDLESHVGLWVGCFPALQPVIRQIAYVFGMRSSANSYPSKKSGAPGGPTSRGGENSQATRSAHRYMRSGSGVDVDGERDMDADSQKGIIDAAKTSQNSIEMGPYGKIRKKTEVRIQIDEHDPTNTPKKPENWVDV